MNEQELKDAIKKERIKQIKRDMISYFKNLVT